MRKGLKKIDIIDRRNTPVLTSNFDGITSAYREYLEAKKIIITHGKISVGISTTLANNFQLFTQALFKINDQEFLIEREGMITLGNCLNPNHQSTLKALVNNESKLVGNNERAAQFWLTTEDRQYYYQKKYQIFIEEIQNEVENNNYRSQVQYLMLEFPGQELVEILNMGKTEAYKEKYDRGCDFLKKHQIEIKPFQFRFNNQVFGSNLNNFYGIIAESLKIISSYPKEFQDKFHVFISTLEKTLLPDKKVLKAIAASKIISSYRSTKTQESTEAFSQVLLFLKDVTPEACLEYIKKKDDPPNNYFPKKVLNLIYSHLDSYKIDTRASYDSITTQIKASEKSRNLPVTRSKSDGSQTDYLTQEKEQKTPSDIANKKRLQKFFSLPKRTSESSLLISDPVYKFGSTDQLSPASLAPGKQKEFSEPYSRSANTELETRNEISIRNSEITNAENHLFWSLKNKDPSTISKSIVLEQSQDFIKKKALLEGVLNKNPNYKF